MRYCRCCMDRGMIRPGFTDIIMKLIPGEYEPAVQNRKSPDSTEPAAEHKVMYRLKAEYGCVSIYKADGGLYDKTDIQMSFLPQSVQIEIINIKDLYSDKELYDFLETYSS